METVLVAAWLVVAVVLLGPPLLGVHRSEWPPRKARPPESAVERGAGVDEGVSAMPTGRCRACDEAGQTGYTYCRPCLTPLPQHGTGPDADARDGQPAD